MADQPNEPTADPDTARWQVGERSQWQKRHRRSVGYYHGKLSGALNRGLGRIAGDGIVRLAAVLTGLLLVALFIAWYAESDDRRLARQHAAWTVIHLGRGLPGDGGRGAAVADLAAMDADMRGAPLAGADLSDLDLNRARLNRADLAGARLSGSNLYRAQFRAASLPEANLAGAELSLAMFLGADLTGAELMGAKGERMVMREIKAAGASFQKAKLIEADLRDADLTGADLWIADLTGATLDGANFTGAKLLGANVSRTALARSTLCRTEMPGGEVENRDC